jgi:predicted ATPase/transcriptional regulator with XRE-family HTH domain
VEDESTFGHLLKRYRRAAHLTQEELAERAGYSSHYVSMLERGVRFPQPLTVDVLADALALHQIERAALHTGATPRPTAAASVQRISPPALPLIGRERAVAQVVRLLGRDDVRLLTLTGPGGVGKSALARQVAVTLGPSFSGGTALVDLSTVQNPEDVIPTLSQALNLREMGGRSIRERLIAFLKEQEMLLLLDSFERVTEGSVALGNLLATCPRITFLVTSRVPLRLQAEYEFRVQPLAFPGLGHTLPTSDLLQSPAVTLFLQRAMQLKPELALDEEKIAVIADICRRLDGLPLAIELAAARVSHLPVTVLRDRLQHRMQFLTGGARDLPARQQRMRDTIAWSYDLLQRPEQALLRRLSVFAGRWSLEAAEGVCIAEEGEPVCDILDGLRTLVDNSLIMPMDDAQEEPRYRMLDTIREYAAEQLEAAGELDELQRRHSAHYVQLAERAELALQDRDQRVWYPRLEWEHDNLRAALDWLLRAGEAELSLRLAAAVWRFWQRRGDIREGRRWLEAGLTAAETEGRHVSAAVRAKALWGTSWLAYYQGDYARSQSLSAEHLALAQEQGDPLGIRNALTGLGMVALAERRHAEAVRALQEALDVCKPLGNVWHRATSFLNLGNATMLAGDLTRATDLFEQALALYQERGDEVFTARTRQHLGFVALLRGEYNPAATLFAQSLQAFAELGELPGIADGLEAVAAVRAATGHARQAGRLVAAATVLRERLGVAPLPYLRPIWQPYVARAAELLGETAWATAREEGRALTLQEAVASTVNVNG